MFFHRQRKLQWLLLSALDDLLPQLTLVLHALELRLDVLLRDLKQAQDAVISFFRNHVKHIPETLRTSLPPCFVNAERHVLRTLFPSKKLNICFALVNAFRIIEPWAR